MNFLSSWAICFISFTIADLETSLLSDSPLLRE